LSPLANAGEWVLSWSFAFSFGDSVSGSPKIWPTAVRFRVQFAYSIVMRRAESAYSRSVRLAKKRLNLGLKITSLKVNHYITWSYMTLRTWLFVIILHTYFICILRKNPIRAQWTHFEAHLPAIYSGTKRYLNNTPGLTCTSEELPMCFSK
jgi:hypothetical protein